MKKLVPEVVFSKKQDVSVILAKQTVAVWARQDNVGHILIVALCFRRVPVTAGTLLFVRRPDSLLRFFPFLSLVFDNAFFKRTILLRFRV